MEEEIKNLIEAQKKLIVDYQKAHEEAIKGMVPESEFKAKTTKYDADLKALTETIVKMQAPGPGIPGEPDKKTEFTKAAFDKYLRKGAGALSPDERKVLTVGDNPAGGYFAHTEFTNELIRGVTEYSPLRTVARIVTTSARSKSWPKKTGSASAAWVSEIGSRTERTNPTFGLEEIPNHEMFALAKVSKQDLEDAQFDLQGFLLEEFREQFGVLEGTAFVSGDSIGKPEGILSNGSITGFTGATTSAKIVADDLKQLFYSLKEAYVPGARWLWKRSSTLAISLLKDAGTNNYLWQPGLQIGTPANILGTPYLECIDMPAEGASAKAVALGDFRRGYIIIDRLEVEVMIDPYSSKSTGSVEISARKRVGGQVVLAEAIKVLTLKA